MSQLSQTGYSNTEIKAPRLGLTLLAILFLPASLYYQPNLGGEGLSIPFNSTVWIAASLAITAGCLMMLKQKRVAYPSLWLLAMPASIVISGFIVDSFLPIEWLFRQLYIIAGFLFLFALFQFRFHTRQIEQILLLLLVAGIVHALYAIRQMFWPALLPEIMTPSTNGSAYGIFQQINLLASFQATVFLIGTYLISRPATLRRFNLISTTVLIAIALSSFIIFYSGSRVGLLSATVGIVIIGITRYRQLISNKTLLISAIMLVLVAAYTGKTGVEKSGSKLMDLATSDEQGVAVQGASSRKNIYAIAFELLKEKPLTGHGIGSFQKVWQEQKVDFLTRYPNAKLPPQRLSHPHNELIFWMVEGGLLAVAGILITAAVVVFSAFRCGWRRGASYLALLLPIALHTQVELPFYIGNIHWLLLMTLIFMILNHKTKHKDLNISRAANLTITASAIACFALTTLFMTHSLMANKGIIVFLKTKMSQPAHLETALNNPYFRENAELYMMRTLLLRDLNSQQLEFQQQFINWAVPVLEYRPIPQLYIDLARAYLDNNQPAKAKEIIDRGHSVYPSDKGIEAGQRRIYELIDQKEPITAENHASKDSVISTKPATDLDPPQETQAQ